MEQQKTFNFNLPSPYQTEMAELARRQRMAETLQQQSAEPVQKFGYGGIEVPISPLSGLAKALQGFTARQIEKDVLQEQKALGEKYRADQMGDVNRLVSMLEKRNATPEIDTGGEYYSPAVQSKEAGAIEPSQISQLRTPEMQNFALQQYLSQLAPKAPIKGSAGDVFFNPKTGAELFRVAEKPDFGQPIREQLPDGTIVTVVYDKQGNRKVVDTGGAKPAISADTEARLKQERELSDRSFYKLSEKERRQLENEAARIGISAEQLYYDTGVRLGRVPGAQPVAPPPAAPVAAPTVRPAAAPVAAPATGLPTPARAPALVQPPAAAAPTQMPTPASMAGMTPKTQQEVLKDQFKAQYASLPEAANKQIVGARNLTQAIDEYQNALKDWSNLKMYNPNARAEMGRVYNNMMLQAKEAYNLGVLNGPDYNILTSVVADPTKPMSAFLTNDTLKKQSEGLKQTAINIEKTAREVHNRSAQGQTRVPRYNPATGRIE
jgi:YD repeat-containing protein